MVRRAEKYELPSLHRNSGVKSRVTRYLLVGTRLESLKNGRTRKWRNRGNFDFSRRATNQSIESRRDLLAIPIESSGKVRSQLGFFGIQLPPCAWLSIPAGTSGVRLAIALALVQIEISTRGIIVEHAHQTDFGLGARGRRDVVKSRVHFFWAPLKLATHGKDFRDRHIPAVSKRAGNSRRNDS